MSTTTQLTNLRRSAHARKGGVSGFRTIESEPQLPGAHAAVHPSNVLCTVEGGITAPVGYRAAGVYCGIRKVRKDLALITSDVPAAVAGVFTQNRVIAAPLEVDKALLERGGSTARAILVNSGNANACTGDRGLQDAWAMAHGIADHLGIPVEEVQISSTGVIGQFLPMPNILQGIAKLPSLLSTEGSSDAAHAIMTTDTYSKEVAVEFLLDGKPVRIGGIAKGSGMIAPNMATMLAFLSTDAHIAQPLLQKIFSKLVDRTFNRISVDGDTSTNDMALMLANGLSGTREITIGTHESGLFSRALESVLQTLARMIARDGEGATKLIEVVVEGARSESEAVAAARSVANSNLVKTAMHGEDANWGRILSAVGYSGIDFDPRHVELSLNGVPILEQNYTIVLDEGLAKKALSQETITIAIDLNQGTERARFWTCDLSKEYVHINASYRS